MLYSNILLILAFILFFFGLFYLLYRIYNMKYKSRNEITEYRLI